MSRSRCLSIATFVVLLLVSCDTDDGAETPNGACTSDDRRDVYNAGLTKSGSEGILSVTLDSGTPAPPDVGDNIWSITVNDTNALPKTGCTITARPWMPDHAHGSSPATVDATETGSGTYRVGPMNYLMAGLWETTLELDCNGTQDAVTFTFCLEG